MNRKETLAGFALALITITIWGTTYIATKTLLGVFQPLEIIVIRFAVAYLLLWLACPRRPMILGGRDELLFLMLGVTGITLYFFLECYAIKFSYTSNVSFILSTIPMITALLARTVEKKKSLGLQEAGCFALSLSGVLLIVTNGYFNLKLSPRGDLLALACAVLWSVYSLLANRVGGPYSKLMVVRKTFFYGLATMIPVALWLRLDLARMAARIQGPALLNLIYLAVFASLLGFVMWNMAIRKIGAVRTSSFIYLVPLITMASSALILKEKITPLMATGGLLILSGVYLFQRLALKRDLNA